MSYIFPFHTVHGVPKARIMKWFTIPFSMDHVSSDLSMTCQGKNTEVVCHSLLHGPHFIRTLHQDLSVLGMDHSLTELHKAVIPVVILVSFCDHVSLCGGCSIIVLASSVCPLMDEDQRPVQASRWEALAVGKTGSCSGEQGLDY